MVVSTIYTVLVFASSIVSRQLGPATKNRRKQIQKVVYSQIESDRQTNRQAGGDALNKRVNERMNIRQKGRTDCNAPQNDCKMPFFSANFCQTCERVDRQIK